MKISEKQFTIGVITFVIICLTIAFGSVWGVFHTSITDAAAIAGAFNHTVGTILLGASALWYALASKDALPIKRPLKPMVINIILGLLIVLSLLFYTGFYVGVY